jgi:Tol biopolymer transport system component
MYTTSGVPVPVVEDVRSSIGQPLADYSLSENGTLVYTSAPRTLKRLVWADRTGRVTPLPFPPRNYRFPALSPDGDRIAAPIWDGPSSDIWIGDVRRGVLSRLTRGEDMETFSLWSPDGRYVLFSSSRPGPFNVFRKPADGTGEAERLTTSPNSQRASGFSADGRLLFFHDQDPVTAQNLWALPMDGEKPVLLVGSSATERSGVLSPDGRWLAYDSDESGHYEVYVQAYPGLGDKKQVSTEGGGNPMWNPKGGEIFFTSEDRLMSVTFLTRGSLQIGTPRLLFRSPMVIGEGPGRREYDVAKDGERFLFVEEPTSPELHVVVNWFEELKRRAPVAGQSRP